MAITVFRYFVEFIRKPVGASYETVPSQVREAWPLWFSQLTQYFATEGGAVLPNFGVNYPRTKDEVEAFYLWWQGYLLEEFATNEQKRRAYEVVQTFQRQFIELFFPAGLGWLGGQVFKTFVPPKCREGTRLGHPNPVMSSNHQVRRVGVSHSARCTSGSKDCTYGCSMMLYTKICSRIKVSRTSMLVSSSHGAASYMTDVPSLACSLLYSRLRLCKSGRVSVSR